MKPPSFQNGEIPLHFAAREGHLRTVKLLLADNAIPDLLNKVSPFSFLKHQRLEPFR